MHLRASLGAFALMTSAFVLQPAAANAADYAPPAKKHAHVHSHVKKPYHKHVHVHAVAHHHAHTSYSHVDQGHDWCLFSWLRHRHHAEAAYTPAPQKVVYAKKVAYKKTAYATPLK